MLRVFLRNPVTQFCLVVILLTVFAGVFAPLLAPHDPYENNILMKFASPSWEYPLGTDQLGRAAFSHACFTVFVRPFSCRSSPWPARLGWDC